ncbi:hypothetical protein [Kordiimonas sp. SCSIO 12610]|uniref:hypothetical protein n=1 Tax=Kordiimonas sp. SCSIO 12610 TaxID=2829597 RepID=UPI00210A9074|nr:hypothetical protein [Kordiimonas sp. SCSIO 12610]UTW54543.1 hypothetical protein KFF44_12120 [Kordiimonas sp. SCSIO 12610]
MSDITTPSSNANPSGTRITDGSSAVTRDPQQNAQQRPENARPQTVENTSEASNARDPAVTIAPTTAGLNVGDNVEETIARVDVEGRPIIVTDFATFALRPDAGLAPGDDVDLQIVEANRQILADLRTQNNRTIDPPIRLELVIVAINNRPNPSVPIQNQVQNEQLQNNADITTASTIPDSENQIDQSPASNNIENVTSSAQPQTIVDENERPPNEPLGEQRVQVTALSENQEPLVRTELATYTLVSPLQLTPDDTVDLNITSITTTNPQIRAEILAINSRPLPEPTPAVLTQVTVAEAQPSIPRNETEAIALAARQSELVANANLGNESSPQSLTRNADDRSTGLEENTRLPTFSVSESDRTLPSRIDIERNTSSSEARNESDSPSNSLSNIERPTVTTSQANESNNNRRQRENVATSFQVQSNRNVDIGPEANQRQAESTERPERPDNIPTRTVDATEPRALTVGSGDNNEPTVPRPEANQQPAITTNEVISDISEDGVNTQQSVENRVSTTSIGATTAVVQNTVEEASNPQQPASLASSVTQSVGTLVQDQQVTEADTNIQTIVSSTNPVGAEPLAQASSSTTNSTAQAQIADTASVPLQGAQTIPAGSQIEVFTTAGTAITLEVLDVATSTVNPANIAQVNGFTPLPIEETRSLSLPITAFASISTELAKIDTTRGPFILPSNIAQNLVGETVAISGISAQDISQLPTFPISNARQSLINAGFSNNAIPNTSEAAALSQSEAIPAPTAPLASNQPQSSPTIGTPILNEQPISLPVLNGFGGFLQNLETLPAQFAPTDVTSSTPLSSGLSPNIPQAVSVAFISQTAIENVAINSASTENGTRSASNIEPGALSQLAALADIPSKSTTEEDTNSSRQLPPTIGPTRITDIQISKPSVQAVASTNSAILQTPNGTITLNIPSEFSINVGDIAIVLPSLNENDAEAIAQQTVATFGRSIANTVAASTPQLDPIALGAWPALNEAISILNQQKTPDLVNIGAKTAQGGKGLTNGLLFILNAARVGSPSAWIGNRAEEVLEKTNSRLLETLKRDISTLINGANDTINEWRPISLPFDIRGGDIPFITMLFKNDPDQQRGSNDDNDPQQHERFVLEIDFKNIGTIQLDGFVKDSKFDLTLRSKADLPQALSTELKQLFKTALDANGFQGSLFVEQHDKFTINVQEALSKSRKTFSSVPYSS